MLKYVKRYLKCFILFSFLIYGIGRDVNGQSKTIQSNILQKKSPNIQLADSLFSIGEKYQGEGNFLQALIYFNKSLAINLSINNIKNTGNCFNKIGTTYYYQGEYLKALTYYNQCIESYKKINFTKGIAGALNNIGAIHYYLGNYPKALEFYKRAGAIQETIGDKKIIAITALNIGGIYFNVKDYDNAMKYYNKAYFTYKKLKDEKAIAQSLNAMGFVYTKQGKYDKSFEALHEALAIVEKEKDKQIKIEVLSNLGELFYKQSNFRKSLSHYSLCQKYAKEINSLQYISDSQIAIGNIFHKTGNNKAAVGKCKTGLKLAEKLGSVSVKKDACECLYQSYKSLNNNLLALHYYEKANLFEDSLKSEETSNKMMNMEFQKQQLVDSIANVKKRTIVEQKHKEEVQRKEKQRNIIIVTLCFMLIVAGGLWSSLNFVKKSRAALKIEKDRSEELLLNILPEEIAEELKQKGSVNARDFDLVSILFTDFKSFTQTAEKMSPQSLVEEINVCFKAFDYISEKYQIEKIKTIGDAYMAAGGIPHPDENSLKNIVLAGLEMQAFMINRAIESERTQTPCFEMRLGIHAGPIVAGIVGVKKFQYDVWGDTVNTASRMESNGMVGKVNISETLYHLIKDEDCFTFEYRGNITAKGKGEIKMYFVEKMASTSPSFSTPQEHALLEVNYGDLVI